jgi:type VI secretion system secreted protein Hcp
MAAFDAFLKIEGIPGESTDKVHYKEIEVLSFHWGISRSGSGGSGGRGRAQIQDFQIVKHVDAATPLLFDAVCSGQSIKEAVFTVRKATEGASDFYKVQFQDVLISSAAPAGTAGGEDLPMEQVSLDFGAVEIEYTKQNPNGTPGETVQSDCTTRRGRFNSE